MTTATDGPARMLGRRPPKNAPALMLADVLTGVVPAHPAAAEHFSQINNWDILGNDKYGDCGPVSTANSRAVVTRYLTGVESYPTLSDVLDLYKRSGNPNFPTDDNGVDMQTMMEAIQSGGLAGVKSVAFAKVDATNIDEVRAAIAIFGCVQFGVTLHVAQQAQTDAHLWDYVAGSGIWGGHAVLAGSYTSAGSGADVSVETWAQIVGVTDTFLREQLDECWVVIWPEHLGTTEFQQGVDVNALASAYKALTGKTLPIQPPPPPPPGGGDTPFQVNPAPYPGLVAALARNGARHGMTGPEYAAHLLATSEHIKHT